jgi:hypothetical protein
MPHVSCTCMLAPPARAASAIHHGGHRGSDGGGPDSWSYWNEGASNDYLWQGPEGTLTGTSLWGARRLLGEQAAAAVCAANPY